ncbi:spore coat protein [Litchfieldia alkalitelluris]|uniref:spore coat protein n=1 Tax=Litchfieldia alkalitelluris TaxID=304268 RepID=UPI000997EF2F|nr:spore coat protein [Litchfieldia alkalitelluris]
MSKDKVSALDSCCNKKDEETVLQSADQVNKTVQQSFESIHIYDSCDITVDTTDTKVAVSLQAALQVAIALVISIAIGDDVKADAITQELLQTSKIKQSNKQKLVIDNSRKVKVKTSDTDVAVSIQVLLQVLVALVAQIDIE